jgi:hypothetical protein
VLHLSVLAAMRRLAALGRDSFTAQARTAPREPPPPKTLNSKPQTSVACADNGGRGGRRVTAGGSVLCAQDVYEHYAGFLRGNPAAGAAAGVQADGPMTSGAGSELHVRAPPVPAPRRSCAPARTESPALLRGRCTCALRFSSPARGALALAGS